MYLNQLYIFFVILKFHDFPGLLLNLKISRFPNQIPWLSLTFQVVYEPCKSFSVKWNWILEQFQKCHGVMVWRVRKSCISVRGSRGSKEDAMWSFLSWLIGHVYQKQDSMPYSNIRPPKYEHSLSHFLAEIWITDNWNQFPNQWVVSILNFMIIHT